MSGMSNRLVAGAIVAFGALGTAIGASSSSAHIPENGPSCELRVERRGGLVSLEPLVVTNRAVDGEYRLRVTGGGSGGSAEISQGGSFSARAGTETVLGSVTLSGSARYDALLEVDANGKRFVCEERIGR